MDGRGRGRPFAGGGREAVLDFLGGDSRARRTACVPAGRPRGREQDGLRAAPLAHEPVGLRALGRVPAREGRMDGLQQPRSGQRQRVRGPRAGVRGLLLCRAGRQPVGGHGRRGAPPPAGRRAALPRGGAAAEGCLRDHHAGQHSVVCPDDQPARRGRTRRS